MMTDESNMPFGKHAGKQMLEAWEDDPKYFRWLVTQDWVRDEMTTWINGQIADGGEQKKEPRKAEPREPVQPPEPEIKQCSTCESDIIWITVNGKPHPVDANIRTGFQLVQDIDDTFKWIASVLHESHFASCPDADLHRKAPDNSAEPEPPEPEPPADLPEPEDEEENLPF